MGRSRRSRRRSEASAPRSSRSTTKAAAVVATAPTTTMTMTRRTTSSELPSELRRPYRCTPQPKPPVAPKDLVLLVLGWQRAFLPKPGRRHDSPRRFLISETRRAKKTSLPKTQISVPQKKKKKKKKPPQNPKKGFPKKKKKKKKK